MNMSMSSEKINFDVLSEVESERHTRSSLSIHPYFGKLDPALARSLILLLSEEGDYVMDPFCGSGTVIHEAILEGRRVLGLDSSPLAVLIAAAKSVGISDTDEEDLSQIRDELLDYADGTPLFGQDIPFSDEQLSTHVPSMPRVRSVETWFTSNALRELAFLKGRLPDWRKTLSDRSYILALTAFSRIIVSASNQQGESTYRSVEKDDTPGRVIQLFADALQDVIEGALAFEGEKQDAGIGESKLQKSDQFSTYRISYQGAGETTISHEDARSIGPQLSRPNPSLVVTSPPYLMSWDYGLYHKFRFYWLGLDLDGYQETEVGRHLRRQNDDVERYVSDMHNTFRSLYPKTSDDARIAMVNAPSVVNGERVDTNSLLEKCGEQEGWQLLECRPVLDIPGPHHGMYAGQEERGVQVSGEAGKKEHVLIFQKESERLG